MEDWIEELESVLSGELLNKPLAKMSNAEAATAFAMLQQLERLVEDRKQTLRERLLDAATEEGAANEKGGYVVEYDGTKVVRERRVATSPNADAIRHMLEKAQLVEEAAFSTKKVTVLDPSKLAKLIELGKLDNAKVQEAKEVNLALKVFPSNEIEHQIKEAQALYAKVFEEDLQQDKLDARGRAKKTVASGPRKQKSE